MSEIPRLARHSWFHRWIAYPVIKTVLRLAMLVLGPIKVRGQQNVPKEGGLLILANHLSDVDPVVVQLACRRPIHFMAKSDLFDMKGLGAILRFVRAFPVKRGEPDRPALKHAIDMLKMGEVVCIFPEGQLSSTGDLQPLKPGVSLIMRNSGCNVICMGFRNSNKVMPYGELKLRRSGTSIPCEWGVVRQFSKSDDTDEIMAWATSELLQLSGLKAMIPEAIPFP